jgi:hypothetical protein
MRTGQESVAFPEIKYKHLLIYREKLLQALKVLRKIHILKLPLKAFKD